MKSTKPQAALDALSRRLQDERDFSNIVHFFFDEVAESRWIHGASAPVRHPRLESMLAACVGRLPGPAAEAVEIYASRYARTDFIHGLVVMGRRSGVFFYFERVDQGLLSVPSAVKPGYTDHLRFTLMLAPAGVVPGPVGPSS
jgi:hypothetical protein